MIRPSVTPGSKTKHAILASLGTDGDLYPFIGIGQKLLARGCRVTLAANEHVGPIASSAGLEFVPLVSREETEELYSNPNFWHPVKSAWVLARWGRRFIRRQYDLLASLSAGPRALLIANTGILAARLVNEKLNIPLVTVLLQPWVIPSIYAPPVFMGGLNLPGRTPLFLRPLYWRILNLGIDLLVGRSFNRVRASLQLRPVHQMFDWWNSRELMLGMFPGWYGKPQPDWPKHLQLAGFPVRDCSTEGDLPESLLDFCRLGKPLLVFTFGTGMMHAAELFRDALEACRILHARAIFLTRYSHHLPQSLPPEIRHCEFASFHHLFPRVSVVVHHGGIGTTAKALASGTPQLILPAAFDQMDNAIRVQELGAGDWLSRKSRNPARMVEAIFRLMLPASQRRAQEAARNFQGTDALDEAAAILEKVKGW